MDDQSRDETRNEETGPVSFFAKLYRPGPLVALFTLAFAGLIIALIKAGWHSLQASRSPLGKGLATSFLVSTAALMVHALSANTFIIIRIMEPYWFLAGLTVMAPLVERKNA